MALTVYNNKFEDRPDTEVDYELDSPARLLGSHTNMIPLQSAVQGTRLFYGARFYNQALPLTEGEAPLVQNLDPESKTSFDKMAAKRLGAVVNSLKKPATVKKVTEDAIILSTDEGDKTYDLYNNFVLNRRSRIHNTPLVKKGDVVEPGQLLARSNFTDEKGSFNMGRNARIALTPYKGHSMEDAIVISQSFADKLKSDAAYGHRIDFKNGLEGGKGKFKALFKDTYVKDQFDKMDDEGVIKIGETVMPGDPLILASRPRSFSSASVDLGSLARNIKKSRSNASVTWDHETPGKVIGVTKTRSGWKVDVTTESPANVGDKIIQRQGQKSIISEILPDEDMPRTEDGRPVEVLMNQLSLPSRVNAAGLYEILLGKIAEKTGQPVEVPSFLKKGENWPAYIRALLKKHGIKSEEKLFDPKEARWLDNPVTVGNGYMIKLHHEVDHKISHRGQGSYDQNEQPAKGGFDGGQAKRMSGLESIGLLSAGAYDFMRESSTLRGQKNDAFWREMRMGNDPKEPGVPFVFKKYLAALKGAGLKASPVDGNRKHLRLGFFTDKDLDEETPIEIQNGDVLDMNTLSPKKGGLFDEKLTQGNRWGKISLGTQLPNPAAEKAIRKLLGLTEKEYRAIISGEKTI